MSPGGSGSCYKQLAVLGISLTVAPLIVIPEIVWQSFTVNVSALELMGYPTMVFSGFLCAVDMTYGCGWFAVTQQIYNALAIKLTTGTWVVILAWLSYAMNTCVTSFMAVCAVRERLQRRHTSSVSGAMHDDEAVEAGRMKAVDVPRHEEALFTRTTSVDDACTGT